MPDPWNSLEFAKLLVSILTPLTVAVAGFLLNRTLQQLQQTQWANQKVIEKRLKVYEDAAPTINHLFCYFCWKGRWKEFSPASIIEKKRILDELFFVNEFLFSPEFKNVYWQFIDDCFEHYAGPTSDARLRTGILRREDLDPQAAPSPSIVDNRMAAFEAHGERWNPGWNQLFSTMRTPEVQIQASYLKLMTCFARELGVGLGSLDARVDHHAKPSG
jgi:hypothetical protein